jgi:putative ABC transport system permease protein
VIRAVRLLNLRRLRRQPVRALITVVAVAAGTSLAVSVVIVIGSVDGSLRDFGRRVSGPAALRIVGATTTAGVDEGLLPTVERTPGVAAAVPMVQAVTWADPLDLTNPHSALGRRHESRLVLALGVDCRVEQLVGKLGCDPAALVGAPLSAPPILSPRMAADLGPDGVVRTNTGPLRVAGGPAVPQLERLNGGRVALFGMPAAQQLFSRVHRYDVIYVQPAPGTSVAELRTRLQRAVGAWNGVLGATDPPPQTLAVLTAFLPLFSLLSLFSLGVGVLLVYNAVVLSIEERRRAMAVTAALGGTARVVVGGALLEAGLLGVFGGLLGTVGGWLVAHPITASLSGFTRHVAGIPLTVHLRPGVVVLGALLGSTVALAAAAVPTRRAMRMDVAAELSARGLRAEAAPRLRTRRMLIAGVVAILGLFGCWLSQRDGGLEMWQASVGPLAFLVVTFGTTVVIGTAAPLVVSGWLARTRRAHAPVRLALANLVRDPGRARVMAMAIGSAVSVAIITASFSKSVEKAVIDGQRPEARQRVRAATTAIDTPATIETKMPPPLLAELARFPGVARVDRGAVVVAGHRSEELIGVVGQEHPYIGARVLRGTATLAGLGRGEVLVGPNLARRLHLRPGDQLQLPTPTGFVSVPVMAVWESGNFGGNEAFMTMATLERLYGPQPSGEVAVLPVPGVGPAELAGRLERAHLSPYFGVNTSDEVARNIADQAGRQMAPFWAIQRGLLVVVFVAVLSTLLLVGVQRKRELGLLSAVGMQPGDLARMILAEGGTIALVGVGLGTLGAIGEMAGMLMVLPLLIGFRDPFVLDVPAAVVNGTAVVVLVLLASSLPAWRTSRLQVVEALQYE